MKTVYEAANPLEAHMITGYLQQLGIMAYVTGEHLQSAAGEVPMTGLVRVQVGEADHEAALLAIREWEQSQPESVSGPVADAPRRLFRGLPVIVAFCAGCITAWLILGNTASEFVDFNGDGILEEEHFYAQDVLQRSEYDRNHDEKPDEIYFYDNRGFLKRATTDDDFNGFFESTTEFVMGQPLSWTQDYDQNGVIDARGSLPTPSIEYSELLNEKTGAVIRKAKLCMGRPLADLVDSDGDGRLDVAEIYNAQGGVERKSANLDAAMSLGCSAKT